MKKSERVVVMVSGGLDSTTLSHWLLNKDLDIYPLFIDYGQHFAGKEFETLKTVLPQELIHRVHEVNIKDIFSYSESRLVKEADLWNEEIVADELILPYRNLLIISAAAAYAASRNIYKVYAAFINSNHAREIDATSEFINNVVQLVGRINQVAFEMPFRDLSKEQVARIGDELGVPIAKTYSCQANSVIHCGVCPNCVDRISALNSIGG